MKVLIALFALAAVAVAAPAPEADPQLILNSWAPLTYIKPIVELKEEEKAEVKKAEEEEEKKIATPLIYSAAWPYVNAAYTYPWATPAIRIAKREAEAEADPQILAYNGAPWAYPYTSAWAYPYAASTYTTTYTYPVSTSTVRIAKREAEAEADPQILAYNGAPWAYPYTSAWAYPYAASTYTTTYTYPVSTSTVRIAKREAEAEADPQILMAYNAAWGMPYAANWAMPYAAAYMPYYWPAQVKTLDNAREKANTPEYAGKGEYVAESAGAVHIAKREADSQILGYSALPYTYAGAWNYPYMYGSAYNWGYVY